MNTGTRLRSALVALAAAAAAAAVVPVADAQTAAKLNPPNAMVATGDSITAGFNACGGYVDCTRRSWSAGDAADTNTHYVRLLAQNPAISGHNENVSISGKKMSGLNDQVVAAAALNPKPDYMTVLLGANDICGAATESGITSIATYRSQFQTAMNTLATSLPDTRVYVVSVPNVYQLWQIGRNDWLSRTTWDTADICQSLLVNPTSTATADVERRDRIRQRVIDYNTQLREVCALILRCRFDNSAVFNTSFNLDEVSNFDSFHPNADGQKKLASVSWAATFDFADKVAPTTSFAPSRAPDGAGGWYDHALSVSLSATDPNSSVKGHEYRRTPSGAFTRYTGLLSVSAEGANTIEARSVDINGNVEASKSLTVTVDPTDPTLDLALPDPDGTNGYHRTSPVVLRASGADERAVHALSCTVDGQPATFTNTSTQTAVRAGDVTVTDDGTHTVACSVEDRAGNSTTTSKTFSLGTVAPEGVVTAGPAARTKETRPSFSFSSTEPTGATYTCAIDGTDLGSCSSPHALTGDLLEGDHVFAVTAVTAAGNPDPTPAEYPFTVDTTAPETTIPAQPATPRNTAVSVGFGSSESPSDFTCEVDGTDLGACSPPLELDLPDGEHTARITATDSAGNSDATPAEATWTVDTRGPVAGFDSGPPSDSNSTSAAFELVSDESGSTFECKLDGALSWSACTSTPEYTGLADGAHSLAIRARDAAGNDGDPATAGWDVDTAPPGTTLAATGPAGPTNATGAHFAFTSGDGSGFECKLDAADWSVCDTGIEYTGLADGSHTFRVRARDAAGNRDGSPAERIWTVDTAAPQTTVDHSPSGRSASRSATVEFSAGEGGATFSCRVDGGAWQAGCTSPWQLSDLADGSHSVEVRATDAAGNPDASPAEKSWIVDATAPQTTLESSPGAITRDPDPEFAFAGSEDGTFECRLDGGAWAVCTSPRGYRGVADGAHAFEARAIDLTGNPDASPARREFTVDTVGPQTEIDSGPDGETLSRDASLRFSAEAGASFECRLDGGAWGGCSAPQSYSGLALGPHAFAVRAADAAGNVDETPATRSWVVVAPAAPADEGGDLGQDQGGAGGQGQGNGGGGGSAGNGGGGGDAVAALQLDISLRTNTKSDAPDAWITVDSGGKSLRTATIGLPKGLAAKWRSGKPGSVGNLVVRSKGNVLRNLKLRLAKRARKPVLLASGGVRVVLTYGSVATIKVTGLPSTSTLLQMTLKGGPLGFAPAVTCQPTAWSVKVTDRASGSAAARGTAPVACRGRRPRGG